MQPEGWVFNGDGKGDIFIQLPEAVASLGLTGMYIYVPWNFVPLTPTTANAMVKYLHHQTLGFNSRQHISTNTASVQRDTDHMMHWDSFFLFTSKI